jgi:protein-tyrosine phosphatase
MTVAQQEDELSKEKPPRTFCDLKPDKDGSVVSPHCEEIPFNFGPASDRDTILFTCERPGGDQGDAKMITNKSVQNWIEYMKSQDIQHVLVLLDDNELEIYEEPGLLDLYENGGLDYFRAPMGEMGASQRVVDYIKEKENKGEKVVAHCTHGMGRSGRVAAGWVVARYGVSPEKATQEAMNTAIQHKVHRMGNSKLLTKWLEPLAISS